MITRVTQALGISQPVLQGGMAWISEHKLAAAVSNAGGLGIISAMNAPADYLRAEIRACRELTDRPFGVNVMLMSPHVEDIAQLLVEESVPVITTGAGMPDKYMKIWVPAGIKVVPVVPSVAIAKRAERCGAVAVIAEGGESGGHIGELNTMALVPQVVDAVSIPVIAAGGIADGRGVAAAFMLGAEGVQLGTRFLCAEECVAHDAYKQKVLAARDIDTTVTGRRLGHPVRALKNRFTTEFARREADPNVSDDELSKFGTGALRKAAVEGDLNEGSFLCGEVAGLVKRIEPASAIVDSLVQEASALLGGASKWVK